MDDMDVNRNDIKNVKNDRTKKDSKNEKIENENKISMSKTGPPPAGTDLITRSPASSSSVGRIFHLLPQARRFTFLSVCFSC